LVAFILPVRVGGLGFNNNCRCLRNTVPVKIIALNSFLEITQKKET
jgi:hypothetical protein